jgi:hypothetical protein
MCTRAHTRVWQLTGLAALAALSWFVHPDHSQTSGIFGDYRWLLNMRLQSEFICASACGAWSCAFIESALKSETTLFMLYFRLT